MHLDGWIRNKETIKSLEEKNRISSKLIPELTDPHLKFLEYLVKENLLVEDVQFDDDWGWKQAVRQKNREYDHILNAQRNCLVWKKRFELVHTKCVDPEYYYVTIKRTVANESSIINFIKDEVL